MKDISHDDAMIELFRDEPATAVAVLNAILADGDQGELLVTLRQMAKASELNAKQLYKGSPQNSDFKAR